MAIFQRRWDLSLRSKVTLRSRTLLIFQGYLPCVKEVCSLFFLSQKKIFKKKLRLLNVQYDAEQLELSYGDDENAER